MRLVLFDFDGTLADSLPWFRGVFPEIAGRHGFRVPDAAEFEALRAMGNREILRRLGVPLWRLPGIAADMRRLKARDAGRIPLFAGVDRMLRRLSEAGLRIGIVSSDAEANVRRTLGPANAALIHDYACGAALFGKARRMRALLARHGVAPGEAIAIGDELRDIEAARRAGLRAGAVTWGYAAPDALSAAAPDLLFASLDEITDALLGGPAGSA
ncbi:MAG: HAD hydrolase-like protein [Acetobacteraceae bacterium]|nr:HAD hydrolase-like protein [Acetobacteraceae bacterium]